VFALNGQADDLTHARRLRQRNTLDTHAIWQDRHRRFTGGQNLGRDLELVVFARCHQVQLIADPLAQFAGQDQHLLQLFLCQLAVRIQELQQAAYEFQDRALVAPRQARLRFCGVHQIKAVADLGQHIALA